MNNAIRKIWIVFLLIIFLIGICGCSDSSKLEINEGHVSFYGIECDIPEYLVFDEDISDDRTAYFFNSGSDGEFNQMAMLLFQKDLDIDFSDDNDVYRIMCEVIANEDSSNVEYNKMNIKTDSLPAVHFYYDLNMAGDIMHMEGIEFAETADRQGKDDKGCYSFVVGTNKDTTAEKSNADVIKIFIDSIECNSTNK